MTNLTVALAGNPNSGKTSLFNELTGANQSVGNWPGVTVEKKEGRIKKEKNTLIQDLPGIYSLSPYTPEEVIARDYLIKEQPGIILNIVDSTNLERSLYLTTQLMEIGLPIIVALNMMDLLDKQGRTINLEKLAYGLGIPVFGMSVAKSQGLSPVIKQVNKLGQQENVRPSLPTYDPRLEVALAEIYPLISGHIIEAKARWYTIKLFERDPQVQTELALPEKIQKEIEEIVLMTETIFEDDSESIVANQRYDFITKLVKLCVVNPESFALTTSDKIDRIVTNRWLALPIFALVMWFVYYVSIQTIGTIGTDWLNDRLFGDLIPDKVGSFLVYLKVADWMNHLILDGIIAGVGAVIGFLPQLIVLFFCLAILEDCGYMARIAFVMDRLFRRFGLSGKSFIPMLVATGCGVPGIMASRTIENEKDRRMTIMVTTFMPCSAKLPIIALIAGALFPTSSWVSPSAYFVGIAAIILSGIALKKTALFGGDPAPFIMELPTYHFPVMKGVIRQTWERSFSFVKKAGTIIFVTSVLIWLASNYNFRLEAVPEDQSMLAQLGNVFAILFLPLGWGNWRATVATLTGLVAKENVVGTFGILYGGMKEVSDNGREVWPWLQAAYTPVSGYSFLLFNLLCAPCFAAIGAMRRELLTWRWTMIAVGYQCLLAYLVSFIVFQWGSFLFEGHRFGLGQVLATLVIGLIVYSLVRPSSNQAQSLKHQILTT